MARMNKTAPKTGRPRTRKTDEHGAAVKQSHDDGLAAWAKANGYTAPDGSPLVNSAKQRRVVERARERSTKSH